MSTKKKSKKKSKGGARGKYQEWLTDEGLLKLEGWARDGLVNEDIAKMIGINPDTLYTWINKYPEISESLKRGKEVVDRQVENALLRRAIGYSYEEQEYATFPLEDDEYYEALETHIQNYKFMNPEATDIDIQLERDNFPKVKKVLIKSKTKEVIPDTTAQIFWLKNRKPDD
ncbi:MAG: transposase [Vagococcus fluvialis]